jgi:hypothetical protein
VNFLGGIADGSTSGVGTDGNGNATYAKLALVVNNTNGTVNINGLGQNDNWSAANSSNGVYNGGGGTKYQAQYSGGTTVNAGRLNANIAGALGSGSVTINGGTLAINASGYAYGTNSYSVNPNGGSPIVTTNTVSGVPITVNSTGTLLLTTNSIVVGNLTIASGGTLGIDSDYTFTASSLALGGTLNFTHLDTTAGSYTLWNGATATGDFSSVLGGALTWAGNAGLWTAADANNNYSLNISSGALTVTAVPEPSTMAAFGLGLGVLGLTVIRRRKAQA